MQFANPNMLWLLLVFPPAMIAFLWWAWRKRQSLMAQFIQARLLPALVSGVSPVRQRIRLGALVLGVVCLIVALARPQWGFTWQEVKQRGVDIVVAIDTSKSMLAQDITPNRLTRAKLAALELMQMTKSDRLGIVAFAGTAFLQCPLTIDDVAFRQSLESLDVNTMPQGGTALAEAIEAAQTAFKEGDNHRVLVLMTDGEDHDSNAVEAAQKAAQAGLKIFTIGIGSTEGELLRYKDPQGREDYVRDEQGNVVKSRLNERLLQEIAGASDGGFYLPLRGAKTIDALYEQGLAKLPKSEHQERLVKQYHERYHWPLGLAIVLFIFEILLPERKRQSVGSIAVVSSPSSKGQLTAVGLALLLGVAPASVFGSSSSALRDYQAGKYDESLKEYQALLEKNADDPRLAFNAGAAAYRNRQYAEAAKLFNQALASPDLKLQQSAYYNRGNAEYWLGEASADPKARTEAWEKSLKDYELSLKLNDQDPDAKHNREFVKKRLEEFKQQQQQQSQGDKSEDSQNQDQQQQQQNQSQQQQNQADSQQDSQQQQQQQQQAANQSQEQKANRSKGEQNEQQKSQASGKPKEDSNEEEREEAQAPMDGQMTPEQAAQLLDAQKGEEKMLPLGPERKAADHARPVKDW